MYFNIFIVTLMRFLLRSLLMGMKFNAIFQSQNYLLSKIKLNKEKQIIQA